MPLPTKPTDLYVTNGWYLELPGVVSPHFLTLSGLQTQSNSVEIVDAGTNIKYRFPSQILDYGELTLTRAYDGSSDDAAIEGLVEECLQRGLKMDITAVKLHNKREAFRLAIIGFRFTNRTMPTFDIVGEDRFEISYTATNDYWFKI